MSTRFARHPLAALFFVVVFLGSVFAPSALAGNTHTTVSHYHGLGDGTDNDYYVHPFIDGPSTERKVLDLMRGSTSMQFISCNCFHLHLNWDTAPYAECLYRVYINFYYTNQHYHNHHYYCG